MSGFYLKHTKKTISAVLLAGAVSSSLVSANTGNLVLTKTGANEDLAETNANKDEPAKEAGIQGGEGSGGYVYASRQNTKDSTSSQSGLKVLSLDPKTLLSILLASSSTASLNSLAKNLFFEGKPDDPEEPKPDDPVDPKKDPKDDPEPDPVPVDPPKPTEKRKKSSNSKLWHLLWLLLIPVGIVLFKCKTPLFIKVFGWDYYLKKFKSGATTASDKITECIVLCYEYKKLLGDEELNKYINSFKVEDLTWDECSKLNNIFTDKEINDNFKKAIKEKVNIESAKNDEEYVKGIMTDYGSVKSLNLQQLNKLLIIFENKDNESWLKEFNGINDFENAVKEKVNIESTKDDGEYVKKTVASYSSVNLLNLQQLNKLLIIFENKDNESWLKGNKDINDFENNVKKEFVKKCKEKSVKSLKFIELSHLICILEDENNEQWLKDIEDVSTFKQDALKEFADDLNRERTCDKLNEDFVKLTYQKYKATYPVSWWRIFEDKRGIYNSLHFHKGIDVDTLAKDLEALKDHVPEQYKGRVDNIVESIKKDFKECEQRLQEYKNNGCEKYIETYHNDWWELYTPEFIDTLSPDSDVLAELYHSFYALPESIQQSLASKARHFAEKNRVDELDVLLYPGSRKWQLKELSGKQFLLVDYAENKFVNFNFLAHGMWLLSNTACHLSEKVEKVLSSVFMSSVFNCLLSTDDSFKGLVPFNPTMAKQQLYYFYKFALELSKSNVPDDIKRYVSHKFNLWAIKYKLAENLYLGKDEILSKDDDSILSFEEKPIVEKLIKTDENKSSIKISINENVISELKEQIKKLTTEDARYEFVNGVMYELNKQIVHKLHSKVEEFKNKIKTRFEDEEKFKEYNKKPLNEQTEKYIKQNNGELRDKFETLLEYGSAEITLKENNLNQLKSQFDLLNKNEKCEYVKLLIDFLESIRLTKDEFFGSEIRENVLVELHQDIEKLATIDRNNAINKTTAALKKQFDELTEEDGYGFVREVIYEMKEIKEDIEEEVKNKKSGGKIDKNVFDTGMLGMMNNINQKGQ